MLRQWGKFQIARTTDCVLGRREANASEPLSLKEPPKTHGWGGIREELQVVGGVDQVIIEESNAVPVIQQVRPELPVGSAPFIERYIVM